MPGTAPRGGSAGTGTRCDRRHAWRSCRRRSKCDKADHLEQMRQAARLQNDAVSYKAQVDNLRRGRERLRLKTEQAAEHLASLDLELQELTEADEALQARLRRCASGAGRAAGRNATAFSILRDETGERICRASRRAQRPGQPHRGAGRTGTQPRRTRHRCREVLGLLEQPDPGRGGPCSASSPISSRCAANTPRSSTWPWGSGPSVSWSATWVLLREALQQRGQPFSGRVSFLPLTPATAENRPGHANRLIELSPLSRVRMPRSPEGSPTHPGIVALAEQLVRLRQSGVGRPAGAVARANADRARPGDGPRHRRPYKRLPLCDPRRANCSRPTAR